MATLLVPHDVPPPNVDAEAIKAAFRGHSIHPSIHRCFFSDRIMFNLAL